MKLNKIIISIITTLLVVCNITQIADSKDSFKGNFDLTKLRKFYDDKDMNPNTKIQELITYLKNEVNNPSRPRMGIGGGPFDTVYIQNVIIGVMGQTVSKNTLLDAFNKESDEKIRDRIMIALVSAGDKKFIPQIKNFLKKDGENILRESAAWALRDVNDKSLEPILLTLQNDNYSGVSFSDVGLKRGYRKVYPVRQAAYEALTKMGAKPEGWILEVPLKVQSETELAESILADENPEQCVTVIKALNGYPAQEARKTINKFLQNSVGKPHLSKAIDEAKKILSIIEKKN